MNKKLLKMIEQLGYTVTSTQSNLRIYDNNNQELQKKNTHDDIYDGVDFISRNGQVIHFDESGFMRLNVNDDITIYAHNLFNEHNDDSITIYYGHGSFYDFVIHFDVCKKNKLEGRSSIFVTAYENTIYAEDDNYFIKEISIIENDNGAVVSLFNENIKYLNIDECTKENYLNILINFLSNIDYEIVKKDIIKVFDIIAPSLISMIDDLVKNREEYNQKKKH